MANHYQHDGEGDPLFTCWKDASKCDEIEFNGKIELHPERLTRFNTRKPKVFAVWNDWCHEDIDHIFRHIIVLKAEFNEQHIVLALTKRPHVMVDFWKSGIQHVPANWWNGLTICTQPEADEKIPVFLQVPGNKFLCLEPLLEEINLMELPRPFEFHQSPYGWPKWLGKKLSAVIVGTETGPHRRPAKLEWIESIIDQCDAAGVPVFVKAMEINGKVSKDMAEWPEKFRRRELPWLKNGMK